jgi:uncharacterized damage-inducible protein DinB
MSLAEHARLLIDYNQDANERVLERALDLDDATLEAVSGSSWPSIGDCLRHIVLAQTVWHARLTDQPPPRMDPSTRAGLQAAFDASNVALREFGKSLVDADWARIINYTDTKGQAHALPIGVLIPHLVNHGTLHRGEAGMLLAAHGRSPGDLDFVLYVLERQAQR